MATEGQGMVYYWNGISGWIRQTTIGGVAASEIATNYSRDILILNESLASPDTIITEGASVDYDIDQDLPEPWIARNLAVTG